MSAIRDEWLLESNSTEFYQRRTPEIIFHIIDHKVGSLLLQTVYQRSQSMHPDKCHFSLDLSKADDFGQVKSFTQLSWNFTAALASRIAWDRFDDKNLPKIALNYKFTRDADRLLESQNGEPPSATDVPDRPRSCADIPALDVATAFDDSPYAQSHHLKVLDATDPTSLPTRPNHDFTCMSKLVTNTGTLNVFVEPKMLNGKWYVNLQIISK